MNNWDKETVDLIRQWDAEVPPAPWATTLLLVLRRLDKRLLALEEGLRAVQQAVTDVEANARDHQ